MGVKRDYVTDTISCFLSRDSRVQSVFVSGSSALKTENSFSDIDLWVVIKEEKDLSEFPAEVISLLSNQMKMIGSYKTTSYHYFVIVEEFLIIDLNFVTCAQYFSLASSNKRFLYSESFVLQQSAVERDAAPAERDWNRLKRLFLMAYAGMFRALSKIQKKELWLIPRFVAGVRDQAILPLLAEIFGYQLANSVQVHFESFSDEHKQYIENTFIRPSIKDGLTGIRACLELVFCCELQVNHDGCKALFEKLDAAKLILNNALIKLGDEGA